VRHFLFLWHRGFYYIRRPESWALKSRYLRTVRHDIFLGNALRQLQRTAFSLYSIMDTTIFLLSTGEHFPRKKSCLTVRKICFQRPGYPVGEIKNPDPTKKSKVSQKKLMVSQKCWQKSRGSYIKTPILGVRSRSFFSWDPAFFLGPAVFFLGTPVFSWDPGFF